MKTCIFFIGITLLTGLSSDGQTFLDRTSEALSLQSADGRHRARLSGLLDLEGYSVDQRPPGLLFGNRDFLNPRLSLFLDAQWGRHVYGVAQARFDRGFDPRARNADARLDEYLLRYTPFDDGRVGVQIGKFATVVGSWVARHDSWNNPFITAPLPYENVTTITDQTAPPTPAAFLARRNLPDNKFAWLPVIWGPAYTSGGALLGDLGKFNYAFDVKNASLSSRPANWDATRLGWEHPTVSGRVGYRPAAAWNHGFSFSAGPYLLPSAQNAVLPAGTGIGDYWQTTLGMDSAYAWRHWQFWAEAFVSRFEVPNVGNADTFVYYLEAKYKFTPNVFGALRWNQQWFGRVPDGAGGEKAWDADMIRLDTALGYRFTRHVQAKLQYSFGHRQTQLQQGEQLVAGQLTIKF